MATVYLLHFERPINPNHTTQHYLGVTNDLDTRLRQHQTGQSQARLPTVAHDLGIDMILARTWPGGRDLERRLKGTYMTIHLGYSTLEELLKQTDRANYLYTMLITDPGNPQQHGYRSDRLIILCQQPEHDLVHYCRIPVGRLTYINGDTLFDPDAEKLTQQATVAYNLVTTWLQEQGYKLITATIATPIEMRYLDGWASFLSYSKEQGFYRLPTPQTT